VRFFHHVWENKIILKFSLSVKIDEHGLDVNDLKDKLTVWKGTRMWNTTEEKPFWAMIYCIPAFQNPTGTTLSEGTLTSTPEKKSS